MPQHRSVHLIDEAWRDLDHKVRAHAQQVEVIGSVMDLAQREPIRNDGISLGLAVRDDVSGVEQLGMMEAAHCTALCIGMEHSSPENWLMQPCTSEALDVRLLRCCQR